VHFGAGGATSQLLGGGPASCRSPNSVDVTSAERTGSADSSKVVERRLVAASDDRQRPDDGQSVIQGPWLGTSGWVGTFLIARPRLGRPGPRRWRSLRAPSPARGHPELQGTRLEAGPPRCRTDGQPAKAAAEAVRSSRGRAHQGHAIVSTLVEEEGGRCRPRGSHSVDVDPRPHVAGGAGRRRTRGDGGGQRTGLRGRGTPEEGSPADASSSPYDDLRDRFGARDPVGAPKPGSGSGAGAGDERA